MCSSLNLRRSPRFRCLSCGICQEDPTLQVPPLVLYNFHASWVIFCYAKCRLFFHFPKFSVFTLPPCKIDFGTIIRSERLNIWYGGRGHMLLQDFTLKKGHR